MSNGRLNVALDFLDVRSFQPLSALHFRLSQCLPHDSKNQRPVMRNTISAPLLFYYIGLANSVISVVSDLPSRVTSALRTGSSLDACSFDSPSGGVISNLNTGSPSIGAVFPFVFTGWPFRTFSQNTLSSGRRLPPGKNSFKRQVPTSGYFNATFMRTAIVLLGISALGTIQSSCSKCIPSALGLRGIPAAKIF